jgi:hypothetical protein
MKLEFSRQISEKYQVLIFMKICPVGSECSMRTEIHNEANALKIVLIKLLLICN